MKEKKEIVIGAAHVLQNYCNSQKNCLSCMFLGVSGNCMFFAGTYKEGVTPDEWKIPDIKEVDNN